MSSFPTNVTPTVQVHPKWLERTHRWVLCRDCYDGEEAVKRKGLRYLPATAGMRQDGMEGVNDVGHQNYLAFKERAVFPGFYREGVEAMVGIMHSEPARIVLPPEMEPLREKCTYDGESLQTLLRKINTWQLQTGRLGLLAEAPSGDGPKALPFIVPYTAEAIVNWDDGPRVQGFQKLEMVVLNETDYERDAGLHWNQYARYRFLRMSDDLTAEGAITGGVVNQSQLTIIEDTAKGVYVVNTPERNQVVPDPAQWKAPHIGGKPLDFIPFVFINSKDLISDPDDPPLLGVAHLAMAVYRGEADYRQNLHMQGQDTLVLAGVETRVPNETVRVGAGAKIEVSRDGKAYYIGVSAAGLSAQRQSIQDDRVQAGQLTSKLLETGQGAGAQYSSGEALKIRVSAKTATLREVAYTGAEGLQAILRMIAQWMGADPTKVKVEPNMKFTDSNATSMSALQLQQAKNAGFPISSESMHRYAVQEGLTNLTFEEEKALLDAEPPPSPVSGSLTGSPSLGGITGGARVPRGVPAPAPKPKAASSGVDPNT